MVAGAAVDVGAAVVVVEAEVEVVVVVVVEVAVEVVGGGGGGIRRAPSQPPRAQERRMSHSHVVFRAAAMSLTSHGSALWLYLVANAATAKSWRS